MSSKTAGPRPSSGAAIPTSHHLDKYADQIAAKADGDPSDLLTTVQAAEVMQISRQWLEIGRCRGWGPPFIKMGPRCVRYRRGDIIEWLLQRTFRSTSEYLAKVGE